MLLELSQMIRGPPGQDTAVYKRVQGLDPAPQNFGKAGDFRDVHGGQVRALQSFEGASGGDQLKT